MKFNIKICVLAIFGSLLITACNKENVDNITPDKDPTFEPNEIEINDLALGLKAGDSEESLSLGCIQLTLPIDLIIEDDSKKTVYTHAEYKAAIEGEAPKRVRDISFPISGKDHNGNPTEFNNVGELGKSFASCVPDDGWISSTRSNATIPAFLLDGYCFDLVYPVDLEDGEGNSYTAENEEEFILYCYEIDPLFFSLPLTVNDEEGNEITFNSVDEFFEALVACEGISPPVVGDGIEVIGFGCLTIQYPFDVATSDGTIITINNEDEYVALLMSGADSEIQFPFSLANEDGEIFVINSIQDLVNAFHGCGIFIVIEPLDCVTDIDPSIILFYNINGRYRYDINLPITLIRDDNGEEVVINDYDDYFDNFGDPFSGIVTADIVYPISIKQFGQDRVLESDEDMCELYESLFFNTCESKPAHIQFFYSTVMTPIDCSIQPLLPLEVTFNATTIELTSYDQYYDLLEESGSYEGIEIVYPVSALLSASGDNITFESDDELCEFLNNCE